MKKFLFALTFISLSAWANQEASYDFNRSKHDPTYEEPKLEGTQVPIEDINTAPSPVPEFEEEALPGTIVPDEGPKPEKPRKKSSKDEVRDEA